MWLQVSEDSERWRPDQFATALQFRLGIVCPGPADIGDVIPCDGCEKTFSATEWPHHVLGCVRRKGHNSTWRAKQINSTIKRAAEMRGHEVLMSPPVGVDPQGHQRAADLRVDTQSAAAIIDWVCVSTCARSERTMRMATSEKRSSYASVVGGKRVLAGCIEVCGAVGPETKKFLKHIANGDKRDTRTLQEILCVSLMKANALILLAARKEAFGWSPSSSSCRFVRQCKLDNAHAPQTSDGLCSDPGSAATAATAATTKSWLPGCAGRSP